MILGIDYEEAPDLRAKPGAGDWTTELEAWLQDRGYILIRVRPTLPDPLPEEFTPKEPDWIPPFVGVPKGLRFIGTFVTSTTHVGGKLHSEITHAVVLQCGFPPVDPRPQPFRLRPIKRAFFILPKPIETPPVMI